MSDLGHHFLAPRNIVIPTPSRWRTDLFFTYLSLFGILFIPHYFSVVPDTHACLFDEKQAGSFMLKSLTEKVGVEFDPGALRKQC